MLRLPLLLLLLTAVLAAAEPAPPALAEEGVGLAVAGMADLTLGWPTMQDAQYRRAKPTRVQRAADGRSATLEYDGGGRAVLSLAATGFDLAVERMPAGAEGVCVELLLPPALRADGRWSCDAASGAFPADKPGDPHFFGGSATRFALARGGRQLLAITTPEGAFHQLTDNRAWNWDACCWRAVVPVSGAQTLHYTIAR